MNVQGGPLPVISRVLTPFIGVIDGEKTNHSYPLKFSAISRGPMSLHVFFRTAPGAANIQASSQGRSRMIESVLRRSSPGAKWNDA